MFFQLKSKWKYKQNCLGRWQKCCFTEQLIDVKEKGSVGVSEERFNKCLPLLVFVDEVGYYILFYCYYYLTELTNTLSNIESCVQGRVPRHIVVQIFKSHCCPNVHVVFCYFTTAADSRLRNLDIINLSTVFLSGWAFDSLNFKVRYPRCCIFYTFIYFYFYFANYQF